MIGVGYHGLYTEAGLLSHGAALVAIGGGSLLFLFKSSPSSLTHISLSLLVS